MTSISDRLRQRPRLPPPGGGSADQERAIEQIGRVLSWTLGDVRVHAGTPVDEATPQRTRGGEETAHGQEAGGRRACPHPGAPAPSSSHRLRARQEARASCPLGATRTHARPELPHQEVLVARASRGQRRGGGRRGISDPAGDGLLGDRQRAAGGEPVGGACGDRRLCRAGQLAHPLLRSRVHDRPDDRRGDCPAGRAEP